MLLCCAVLCCASLELVGASGHDQTNDQAEEAQNTAEYFDDQDLDEELRISSICYGGIATCDTHCNTAAQIAHAYRQSSPKQHVPSEVVAGSPESIGCTRFEVARDLGREHNRHDNAIDRHHFAEDDPAVNSPSEKKEAKTSMLEPGSKLQSEKQGKQPKTEKKNVRNEVLCGDAWGSHTSTQDARTGDKDAPASTYHGETDAQADADHSPSVRRGLLEERANVERFTIACGRMQRQTDERSVE